MFRVLRFTPKATLAEVARSICRTPARRIALVFPLGDRTRFANKGWMDALAALCREHHKDATIVGGDELLRASAVAGGLRAAVTLDDWREAQPERSSRRARARLDVPVRLAVIERPENGRTADNREELDDPFDVDPPAYVRELLALYGSAGDDMGTTPARETGYEPIRLRRPFVVAERATSTTRHAYDHAYDLDSAERLRAISEDDEERLTATIRRTSGLDAELFAKSWPGSLEAAAPDGPNGSR
jgi:hypothetical protein